MRSRCARLGGQITTGVRFEGKPNGRTRTTTVLTRYDIRLGRCYVEAQKYYLDWHAEHGSDSFETLLYDGETEKALTKAWPGTIGSTNGCILDASGWPGFVEFSYQDQHKGDGFTDASRFIDTLMSEKNDTAAPKKKGH